MVTPLVSGLVCYLRALIGGLSTPKEAIDRILKPALRDAVSDVKDSVKFTCIQRKRRLICTAIR